MIEDDTLHADLDDICSVLYSAIFQLVVVVKTLGQVQIFHAMVRCVDDACSTYV